MDDKKRKIELYIRKVAKRLNRRYANCMPNDKVEMAIQMYIDYDEDIKQIRKHINKFAKDIQNEYKKTLHRNIKTKNKYINKLPSKKESKTYEEIEKTIKVIKKIEDKYKLRLYISGGVVPYLLLDRYSTRFHDDIDIICELKDMEKIREAFKKEEFYKYDLDSTSYATDGIDYGFSMFINDVLVGIYPFTYKDQELTQYSYDSYLRFCKIKKIKLEGLSDYVKSYKSKSRVTYNTMSLEYIMLTKKHANREKDKEDLNAIEELNNIRENVYNRLNMYEEIQNASVEDLEYDNEHKIELKTENLKKSISIDNKGKKIQEINSKKRPKKVKKV